MGYYVNPRNQSKEEFLIENGRVISQSEANNHDFSTDTLPVCLVDNGMFTAAGIGFDAREVEAFSYDDGRDKMWFSVSRDILAEFM